MQVKDGETQNSGPGQTVDTEPDSQPWARFKETVLEMLRDPLEVTRQQVDNATQDLTDKVQDLSSSHRNFEDDLQRRLKRLTDELAELQERAAITSAEAAAGLAVLREAVDQVVGKVDGATEALRMLLDAALEAMKQEFQQAASRLATQIQQSETELRTVYLQELTSQIGTLDDPLRAIRDEARAMEERANTRQDTALASLREAIGQELSAASRRSSDADQARAQSLTHLRWTSYALLTLLSALAAGLLVVAIAH